MLLYLMLLVSVTLLHLPYETTAQAFGIVWHRLWWSICIFLLVKAWNMQHEVKLGFYPAKSQTSAATKPHSYVHFVAGWRFPESPKCFM